MRPTNLWGHHFLFHTGDSHTKHWERDTWRYEKKESYQHEPHKKENEKSFTVGSFSIRHSPWNCISKWKWHLIKAFSYREERKSFARLDNTFQKSIKNIDYSVQKQIPELNYAI